MHPSGKNESLRHVRDKGFFASREFVFFITWFRNICEKRRLNLWRQIRTRFQTKPFCLWGEQNSKHVSWRIEISLHTNKVNILYECFGKLIPLHDPELSIISYFCLHEFASLTKLFIACRHFSVIQDNKPKANLEKWQEETVSGWQFKIGAEPHFLPCSSCNPWRMKVTMHPNLWK